MAASLLFFNASFVSSRSKLCSLNRVIDCLSKPFIDQSKVRPARLPLKIVSVIIQVQQRIQLFDIHRYLVIFAITRHRMHSIVHSRTYLGHMAETRLLWDICGRKCIKGIVGLTCAIARRSHASDLHVQAVRAKATWVQAQPSARRQHKVIGNFLKWSSLLFVSTETIVSHSGHFVTD